VALLGGRIKFSSNEVSVVTHYPPMFISDDTEFSARVAFLDATIGFRAAFSAGASSEVARSLDDGVASSQYGRLVGSHSAGLLERSSAVLHVVQLQ